MTRPVALVLLGAGASYGSGETYFAGVSGNPRNPPLGNRLFEELERARGLAARLPEDLKRVFRANFETGMSLFFEQNRMDLAQFQRELCLYLASFTPGPKNHFLCMLRKLAKYEVIYSTLNYDLLFECSAAALGKETRYDTTLTGGFVNLLKLHGSSNFWPDRFGGKDVGSKCIGTFADEVGPLIVLNQAETIRKCKEEDSGQPAIAVFGPGKRLTTYPQQIHEQQVMWLHAVATASIILISGVGVHTPDAHIWGPLGSTQAAITYFGFGSDRPAFEAWKKQSNKANATFQPSNFENCIPRMKRLLDVASTR